VASIIVNYPFPLTTFFGSFIYSTICSPPCFPPGTFPPTLFPFNRASRGTNQNLVCPDNFFPLILVTTGISLPILTLFPEAPASLPSLLLQLLRYMSLRPLAPQPSLSTHLMWSLSSPPPSPFGKIRIFTANPPQSLASNIHTGPFSPPVFR